MELLNVLLMTPLNEISTHIHVATLVTIVWCLFSFAFARDKKDSIKTFTDKGIPFIDRIKNFFKSDISISFMMFVILIVIVIVYYI